MVLGSIITEVNDIGKRRKPKKKSFIIEHVYHCEQLRVVSPEKHQEVVNTSQSYPTGGKRELELYTMLLGD